MDNSPIFVDANVILRWILNDIPSQNAQAKAIIASGNAFLLPEVLAEVVYVLKRVYKMERPVISSILVKSLPAFQAENREVLNLALNIYAERALDFVDCVLASYSKLYGANVKSFDEKLQKFIERNKTI